MESQATPGSFEPSERRHLFLGAITLLGLGILFDRLTRLPWPISDWPIGTPSRYCEQVAAGPIREPSNTASNLAFVFSGALIFLQGALDRRAPRTLARNPMIGLGRGPTLLAIALIALGFGSALFHSLETPLTGIIDNLSMMPVICFYSVYNLARILGWSGKQWMRLYSALLFTSCAVIIHDDSLAIPVGDCGVLLCVAAELLAAQPRLRPPGWPRHSLGRRYGVVYFLGFIGQGIASRVIWALSKAGGPLCDPRAVVQGHAVWHVFVGMGLYCYYLHLRSEAPC